MNKTTANQPTASETLITLQDICYAYDQVPALKHLNLSILRGHCCVLMGSNGCGKSTLLKLLNGLIFPVLGTYTFDGTPIDAAYLKNTKNSKLFHKRIGYVFQDSDIQLFCSSVEEEIAFGPRQMQLPEEEIHRRTQDCLNLLEITHLKDRAPYHLSGGEKRKVAIACVLALNPDVLILDEPLNTLDDASRQWLTEFLCNLKTAGKTMIIATHDKNFADIIADEIFDNF